MVDQDIRYRLADLLRDLHSRKPEAIEAAGEVLAFFKDAGLVIVPKEATDEMRRAGREIMDAGGHIQKRAGRVWCAMVDAVSPMQATSDD